MKTRPRRNGGSSQSSGRSSQSSHSSSGSRQQNKLQGKLTDSSAKHLVDDILDDSQYNRQHGGLSRLLTWDDVLQESQEVKAGSGGHVNNDPKTEEDCMTMEREVEDEEMDG